MHTYPSPPRPPAPCLDPVSVVLPQVPRAASVEALPISQLPDEQRAALAAEFGYKSIGKELPDGVSLTDIIRTMPSEVGGEAPYGPPEQAMPTFSI